MFKKINSDNKAGPNVFTEIKKEFGGYFGLFNTKFKAFCEKHPKQIFTGMVATMLISMILSFTVIIPMEKRRLAAEVLASQKKVSEKNLKGLREVPGNNLNDVILGIGKMKSAIIIKQRVDAILSKKHLTTADSIYLNGLLDSLRNNERALNPKNKP